MQVGEVAQHRRISLPEWVVGSTFELTTSLPKHAGFDTWIWLAHNEASYDYCVVMYSTERVKALA